MFDMLSEKFSSIIESLSGAKGLSRQVIDDTLNQFADALLHADVPQDIANDFIAHVRTDIESKKTVSSLKASEQIMGVVRQNLVKFLGEKPDTSSLFSGTTLVMGLQGAGKTTTIAKLAHYARQRKKNSKILVASVDFYRPAAVDQLAVLAQSVDVDFYRSTCSSPVEAAVDIHQYARNNSYDCLFLDTAGRLHVDQQLLTELQDIARTIDPQSKILVIDAMTGQQSLEVAQHFNKAIGFDGAILAKMDSQAAGGAAFAFQYALKKPILFWGAGEKPSDLELFKPERSADRILGHGDLATLAERAEKVIKQEEQKKIEAAMMSGKMTLEDFAQQLEMMNRMGPLASMMKYMPRMGGLKLSDQQVHEGQQQLKMFRAIMSSMTHKERRNHRLLNRSRKQRIARGAGVQPVQIDMLIQRFEQMQQFATLFKRM